VKGRTAILLLVSSPILVLVLGAIVALCISTSPNEVFTQLHQPAVQDALLLSLRTTLASLVIIVLCGTPLALLIRRRSGWLGTSIEFLITLPAIMPPSVAGLALLLAFGRRGLIGASLDHWGIKLGFTTIAVIMAQTLVATPFYVREAANAFQALQPSVLESARLDGATPLQLLNRIMVPGAAPFLITGAILAWARALSEFGATILFAGSLQGVTQTLPIAIYIGFETNISQAKAIALILLVVAAVTLILLRVLFRRSLVYAH
jgi:molybdate transport system permease protein